MTLSAGTRLGPYEIIGPLGAGGMGEVYRARDTRLARDVALKILPKEVAHDASRRQRFELEARAVAALNHPNIVAVYDVGEGFIVSELVDGSPLRALKPGLRRAIEIAVQIADGMAAAHAAGITHRDLKPDNILLTRDGRVKILDFGLAKVTAPRAAAAATETVTVASEPGVVMGTVGYMSPEQVRGQPADSRSDIFSFGLILYELIAGKRAFTGDTSIETMTAILKQDAPELPESVPGGVRRIIAHCLEKEPDRRFQSARDLAFALSTISQTASQPVPAIPQRRFRRRVWAAAAALILAVVAVAAYWFRRPAPARWNAVLLGGPEIALTPKLSPDGHLLAFVAVVEDVMQIGVMKLESGDHTILTHATDKGYAGALSWSPDGSRIYYDRWTDLPRGIYSISVLGGAEQLVLEDAGNPEALPDGSLLVGRYNSERQYQMCRVWLDTGRVQPFPLDFGGYQYVAARAFPDGNEAVAFGTLIGTGNAAGRRLYSVDLRSGSIRPLLSASRGDNSGAGIMAPARDGKSLLYAHPARNGLSIDAISRDGKTITPLYLTLTAATLSLDAGPDGSIYVDQTDRPTELLRFAAQGGHAEKIAGLPPYDSPGAPWGDDEIFAILPDGRAAVTQGTGGRTHLVVIESGKPAVRLVTTTEETSAPVTTLGKSEAAFLIGAAPRHEIGIAALANSRLVRRIRFDQGPITSLAGSPDGKTLYCAAGGSIWAIPREAGDPKKLLAGDHVAVDPSGQYLVVQVTENPIIRLMRFPLPGGPEQEIRRSGDQRPAFLMGPNAIGKDGRILMPIGTSLWYWPVGVLDPSSGQFTRLPVDRILDYHVVGWTPDGRIMALGLDMRGRLWKFSPETK